PTKKHRREDRNDCHIRKKTCRVRASKTDQPPVPEPTFAERATSMQTEGWTRSWRAVVRPPIRLRSAVTIAERLGDETFGVPNNDPGRKSAGRDRSGGFQ